MSQGKNPAGNSAYLAPARANRGYSFGMPGQRIAVGRRARGSRVSRLAGISVILVLAAGGATGYLVTVHPSGAHPAAPLPTTVVSNQTIGLVAQASQPASSGQLLQLQASAGVPEFSPVTLAEQQAGTGQWTADQMGDDSYIFIFVATGSCLTAANPATVALRHCDLASDQRWRRTGHASLAQGHNFYQYANVRTGRCLTEAAELPGPAWAASLSACSPSGTLSQLVAFWLAPA